jgi:hypothetical protein
MTSDTDKGNSSHRGGQEDPLRTKILDVEHGDPKMSATSREMMTAMEKIAPMMHEPNTRFRYKRHARLHCKELSKITCLQTAIGLRH